MILRSGKTMARWLRNLPPYHFDQTEKLWLAAILAGVIYVALFAFVPGFENFGWPCIWKRSTGVECLGCGFTRSCGALAKLEWRAAFMLNPLVYIVVPLLAVKAALILAGLATGKSWGQFFLRPRTRPFLVAVTVITAAVVCFRLSQMLRGL